MQDDNAFTAARNGYQTGGFVNSQISAQAGAEFGAATRPNVGTAPIGPTIPVFNGGGLYYGGGSYAGPARPFPTWIVVWFLIIVGGYIFARPQTVVLAAGGLLGAPLLVLGSRVLGGAERATAWRSFKCACFAIAAYMLTKVVVTKTHLIGQISDLESDIAGVVAYGVVVAFMLRKSFGGMGGFIKACVVGAVTLFLLTLGMGIYAAMHGQQRTAANTVTSPLEDVDRDIRSYPIFSSRL